MSADPRTNVILVHADEDILMEHAKSWKEPLIEPDTLAFLQYTSGSTGAPIDYSFTPLEPDSLEFDQPNWLTEGLCP